MLKMKKNIIVLIAFVFMLSSCRSSKALIKESWLEGKWIIVAIDTGEEIDEDVRAEYDEIMSSMIKNAYMQFKSDYSFEMQLMGQKVNGNYRTNNEGNEIITSIEGEEGEDHFKVLMNERGNLILEVEDNEGKMKLTLVKEI